MVPRPKHRAPAWSDRAATRKGRPVRALGSMSQRPLAQAPHADTGPPSAATTRLHTLLPALSPASVPRSSPRGQELSSVATTLGREAASSHVLPWVRRSFSFLRSHQHRKWGCQMPGFQVRLTAAGQEAASPSSLSPLHVPWISRDSFRFSFCIYR